jgi:hypothetical protein
MVLLLHFCRTIGEIPPPTGLYPHTPLSTHQRTPGEEGYCSRTRHFAYAAYGLRTRWQRVEVCNGSEANSSIAHAISTGKDIPGWTPGVPRVPPPHLWQDDHHALTDRGL